MKTKIVFHPYIPAMVNQVEKWLTEMSCDGWQLVHKDRWKFYFIKSKKQERQYFIYSGFDASRGISYEYYSAKELYAKSGIEINKQSYDIFEVDPSKIDSKFYGYRMMRNKYYKNHYIKLAVFSSVFLLLSLVISFFNIYFFIIGVPYLLVFIYAITSVLIISRFTKQ